MTEQTPQDETREEEKHKPEPRDAAYWARYAETLKVTGVAEGATDWAEALRRHRPDLVTVATPASLPSSRPASSALGSSSRYDHTRCRAR